MNAQLVRPSVGQLVFRLYDRQLHPELFDTLAVYHVRHEDAAVVLRVTRAGHVITWEKNGRFLTEVAAAGDDLLPQRGSLLRYRLRGEHQGSITFPGGLCYQTSFQVEQLPPEIYVHIHDELLADGDDRGFLHKFQPYRRLALAPLAYINLAARPASLTIHTFHTFPEEYAIVKTQSLVEW